MSVAVLDSSVWIEYFAGRPKAAQVEHLLADPARILVPAAAVYEVYKRLKSGAGKDVAEAAVGRMLASPVVPIDADLALQAADLAVDHKLAMADAFVLATARVHGAELVTLDADFKGVPGSRLL